MPKSAVISARVDADLKQSVEQVFDSLGLNITQAITLFFKQVELQHGLPFPVRVPNTTTRAALAEARARENLKSFESIDDLFADLDAE